MHELPRDANPEGPSRADELRATSELLLGLEPLAPPRDLSQRIMRALPRSRPGRLARLEAALARPFRTSPAMSAEERAQKEARACAMAFVLVGLFYALLGLVLAIALRGPAHAMAPFPWLAPLVRTSLAAAVGFTGLGFLLKARSKKAFWAAVAFAAFNQGVVIFHAAALVTEPGAYRSATPLGLLLCAFLLAGAMPLAVMLLSRNAYTRSVTPAPNRNQASAV